MFSDLTAWFSSSVGSRKKKIWRENGGTEATVDEAQFVFSQDATCQDTLRVFESDAYLDEHLSVFHANYINECVKLKDVKKGVLGKYFLPPKDVQDIARQQMQYQWEYDGHTSDGQSHNSDSENEVHPKQGTSKNTRRSQATATSTKHTLVPQPSTSSHPHLTQATQNIYIHDTQSTGAKQQTRSPDKDKQSHDKFNDSCKRRVDENNDINENTERVNIAEYGKQRQTETKQSPKKKTKNGNVQGLSKNQSNTNTNINVKMPSGQAMKNDGNNCTVGNVEDSEYLRLEDLAKVTGDVQDFIVGQSGCEIVNMNM